MFAINRKLSTKEYLKGCLWVLICATLLQAKTAGDPGEGGGNGNEIGPYSGAVLSGGGYVNPLTLPAWPLL